MSLSAALLLLSAAIPAASAQSAPAATAPDPARLVAARGLIARLMPADRRDAMARAYARGFTLEQLSAISGFYDMPAGHAYAELAPTIMADPDVLAAQRAMMTEAMAGMQQRIAAMAAELAADEKQDKK